MKDRLKINYAGKEREFLMSYALLVRILKQVGEDLSIQDPDNMEAVQKLIFKEEDIPEDLSLSEGLKITNWAVAHVLDFFIQKTETLGPKIKKMGDIQLQLSQLSG